MTYSAGSIAMDNHETGETRRRSTVRWTGLHDDLDLFSIPQWHRQAECTKPRYAGISFIGDDHRGAGRTATDVCMLCPVRAQCLEEALHLEAESRLCFGVRGGKSAAERLVILGRTEQGTVYFGRRDDLIKIGTTRAGVASRARVNGLTILATEPGSYTRESVLHQTFAEDRVRGEWFVPSDRLLAYIDKLNNDQAVAA